jgi:uncharacterized repeat protein (TIGR01451 family)
MTQANTRFKQFIQAGFVLTILFFLVTFAGAQTCVQPPAGIVAWWSFDETSGTTALDVVGGNNGTYVGTPQAAVGMVGGSLQFDGMSTYVVVPDSDLWAFGTSDFTIEFWANFDVPAHGNLYWPGNVFLSNDNGPFNVDKWIFALSSTDLELIVGETATNSSTFSPVVPFVPEVGRWYHLALTRSGTTYKIYVDGVQVGSPGTNLSVIPNPASPLTIGAALEPIPLGSGMSFGGVMSGRLDEVTIYHRQLTDSELLAIVAAGSAGKCKNLAINTQSLSTVMFGEFFSQAFKAVFGAPPFAWSIVNGMLPSGVNLSPDGILSGTPTEAGDFPFTVRVTDSNGDFAEKTFTLKVLPAQMCVQPPAGIVAWWPFDETSGTTAVDVVGGNNGTYVGTPQAAGGMVGGSLQFDGMSTYVVVPDSDLWAFGTSDFTLEFWANFDVPAHGDSGHPGNVFLSNDNGPFNVDKWIFALSSTDLEFITGETATGSGIFSPVVPFAPEVGRWYHLALTRSGTTYKVYVDGVQVGSTGTNFSVIPNPASPLTIGAALESFGSGMGFAGVMSGRLDEVTIYHRQLTDSELLAIVAAGGAGKCKNLAIRTASLSAAMFGEFFTQAFEVVFGAPPFAWSIVNGILPSGVNLNSDGVLSGTPSEAGDFPFTVRVTDSNGAFSEKAFTLKVLSAIDAPVSSTELSEKSFSEANLVETILAKTGSADNLTVSGYVNGTLNLRNFELVTVETGTFAGKGFSKAEWQADLEGFPYNGNWVGMVFLRESERRIYIKGAISGDLTGIIEGYLSETTSGSGLYDQYQATWRLNRVGSQTVSGTISLNGSLTYQATNEYPSTQLHVLQTSIEGTSSGHYTGPLSAVLTHLGISDNNNPYYGQGLSIISYISDSGSGEGWTYDNEIQQNIIELKGLFTDPLLGIVTGTLDETQSPRTLFLTIERLDLGSVPMADLQVKTWGSRRVSPGQTVDYIIEVRNDGLRPAENVILLSQLPSLAEYVESTQGGIYRVGRHQVFWKLGNLEPNYRDLLYVRIRYAWGISLGTSQYIFSSIKTSSPTRSAPPFDFELEEYLAYPNLQVISSRMLTPEEITNELLDPQTNDLYNYGTELGFDLMLAGSQAVLGDNSEVIRLMMVNSSTNESLLVTRMNNNTFIEKHTPDTISFFDRNGSVSYSVDSNSKMDINSQTVSGTWGQTGTGGLIHKGFCINNCLLFEFGIQLIPIIGSKISTIRDCVDCFKGNLVSCVGCLNDLTIGIPGLSQLATIENCVDGCLKDPDSYACKNGTVKNICANDCHPFIPGIVCSNSYECRGHIRWAGPWNYCNLLTESFAQLEQICVFCAGCAGGECYGKLCSELPPGLQKSQVATASDPNIKYGPDGSVMPGQKLNYRVESSNKGEGIAYGVYFTDTLDKNLDDSTLEIGPVIDTSTGGQIAIPGRYNSQTRTITWFVGEVGPHQGGYANFNINVKGNAANRTEIINFATIYFPSVPETTRTNGIVSQVITEHTITATGGLGGSITPSGSVTVNYGSSQTFTITPNEGYHVADVKIDGVSVGAVTTYTLNNITSNHTIDVIFAINQYTLIATAGPNGTIVPSGALTVDHGGNLSFTITPSPGYHVSDVKVDGGSVGAVTSYTFSNITSAHTIEAIFAINQHTIIATAGSNGTITPSGTATVDHGGSQTFTITPNTGYRVSDVEVDGTMLGVTKSYTFSNVTSDHTIHATFKQIQVVSLPFTDNFEDDTVGIQPNLPWDNYNGGPAMVTDSESHSPPNSISISTGPEGSGSAFVNLGETYPDRIAYEVWVKVNSTGNSAYVGFSEEILNMIPQFNAVYFNGADGKVYFTSADRDHGFTVQLQDSFAIGVWHKVRVQIDFANLIADVFIDDVRVGSSLPVSPKDATWEYEGTHSFPLNKIGVTHGLGEPFYFDDFSVSEWSPNTPVNLLRSAGPGQWAVLGMGGIGSAGSTSISMSGSSSIRGTVANAGVANAGNVNMSGSSLINGILLLNTAGRLNKSGSSAVAGGVQQNTATDGVLDQAVTDALAASQSAASLPTTITSPTSVTISNPSQNITITGGLGTNVLHITNLAISNGTVTLSAPSGGCFIMNVSGSFALSGASRIVLAGGITASDVLYNFVGSGGSVAMSGGSSVTGILLAPQRGVALSSSTVTGEIISGGSGIAFSGTAQVSNPGP